MPCFETTGHGKREICYDLPVDILQTLQQANEGERFSTQEVFGALRLSADGLIPAIAQQFDTGEVLMMAWMNRESIQATLDTGRVTYWSRSRQKLWKKGETSGQVQRLKRLQIDCDADTLLLQVDQTGPACHTGRRSCFYIELDADTAVINQKILTDPRELYPDKSP